MDKKPWYSIVGSKVMQIVNWFASSVDNHTAGPSGRKLTAITIMALIIHGHLKYVDSKNFYDVLIVYVVFVSVLLGIVTIEQIIKFFGDKPKDPPQP